MARWDGIQKGQGRVIKYANCQFMTPETRSTTHFFWDYLHNYDSNIEDISASLKESLVTGFMEDKIFIEEQQKYLPSLDDFSLGVWHLIGRWPIIVTSGTSDSRQSDSRILRITVLLRMPSCDIL